ncbi:D-xylose dehydrogenase [Acaryochloris thomasi RCC1774]|uniref:D-xylose dehydrogenase n=1 Tax=Acaryochloris thomasi RCC1774 TaxID=1764569 RepID=A0A2W1JHF8_9CYAN|nr:Gfo/Idh/MocA family oxidoreductase [Acaryochloris thomasi]PZD72990.1 D-xylose dehydrogenase [Acaryochloris thomasi RCC1774]
MTSDTSIGIAVVGTGFGQKVHIPAFQDAAATEVVAVYNRDRSKAQQVAAAHQIDNAADSLEEIVSLPGVQGVSLSTPPFLHYEMAQKILKAGKHLFLEKPTTLTASEAKSLHVLAQQHQVQATLNFEFRFVPAWMHLKHLLDQTYVGQTRLIKVDWLVGGRADPQRPWSWHASKELGGGSLGALGSHTFDYIAWLFGSVKRLSAQLITSIQQRPDPQTGRAKSVDADDTCVLMLELMSGTICQVNISATAYAGRGHWVEVYGDRGTLVLGMNTPNDYVHGFELQGSQSGAPLETIEIPDFLEFQQTYDDGRIAPTKRVIDHWAEMIQTGKETAPSLREGVYSQLLMDLAHQSHQQQCWVDVPVLETFLA